MNFTREPIIETIITPKEGYKLIVRSSKGGTSEEYSVDAIEVVSFGRSFFYRSLERPKSFLLPVSDYEVIESKETRVVLKNVPLERSIKIGGGKVKTNKDSSEPLKEEENSAEKPKRRKSLKRRKPSDEKSEPKPQVSEKKPEEKSTEDLKQKNDKDIKDSDKKPDGPQVSSTMFKSLLPPPPSLIKKQEIKIPEPSPKPSSEESSLFSEDNMEKPDVETPQEIQSQEVKTEETPKSEETKEEQRSPIYHEAPLEPPKAEEETPKKSEEEKDGDSPVHFKAENNFAF